MKRYRGITEAQRQRVTTAANVLTTELRSIIANLPKQDRRTKAIIRTLRNQSRLNFEVEFG
jgi:hypothetical protein